MHGVATCNIFLASLTQVTLKSPTLATFQSDSSWAVFGFFSYQQIHSSNVSDIRITSLFFAIYVFCK